MTHRLPRSPHTPRSATIVLIFRLLWAVVFVFFVALVIRLVIDWIQVFAREWRPKGVVLVLAEVVYSITDPPLRALRAVLPPLSLGAVRLDLAFLVLFIVVTILLRLLPPL